ncbi:Protein kinase-like domain [Pleurostoma richardsiae]|uniref:Protein kinase-like domain n=1 Tax=Pleurostoma richardsiae TaxID=41990 RepID=A0AA38VNN8_9PEZI|nr:Protein kinase-like domain [Pleurostoma richardsiae]
MSEQDELQALGVTGEWIWGDDARTAVFAQAFGNGRILIFRFSHRNDDNDLPARLVNYYYRRERVSFPSRASMRAALWSAVASVWPGACKLPDAADPAAIVDVFDHGSWRICHDRLFDDYVVSLLPLNELSEQLSVDMIDLQDLERHGQLGGRGCTTLVHHVSDPAHKLVFKGVDFRTFLYTYESGRAKEEILIFKRSIELLSRMPRHPNILPPPLALVTVRGIAATMSTVCGCLYPFYTNGSLASKIQESNAKEERISLQLKAKWCYQMAVALAHTHFVAHTYHMDVKPGNFLLDEDLNLVLADWERSDAAVTIAAPEIDGTWDAEETEVRAADGTASTALRYTKYQGKERRNMPENTPGSNGWNVWNPFLAWQDTCPRASELAEVFSLGRSMWMLLRQCNRDELDGILDTRDVVEDWTGSDDIPAQWKEAVDGCLRRDPDDRTGLLALQAFWETAWRGVAGTHSPDTHSSDGTSFSLMAGLS